MRFRLAAPFILSISASTLAAQSSMQAAPSGRGSSEVVITPVDSVARANSKPLKIRIDYGQPNLRGRALLTDSLVPYDKPWRTGANASTTLTTHVDLILGGMNLPKGSYIMYTLPGRSGWKLIVQKDPGPPPNGIAAPYDSAKDLGRLNLRGSTISAPLETFTMWLIPSRDPGSPHGMLVMAWGTVLQSLDWALK